MGPMGIFDSSWCKDSAWRCQVENSEQSENSEGVADTRLDVVPGRAGRRCENCLKYWKYYEKRAEWGREVGCREK